jgi:outer membrane lipopolysaccharide assembly protein LptE/RlpB
MIRWGGFLIFCCMLLLPAGCGYRLAGRSDRLPPDVQRVYVEVFENRTPKPFLESNITNAVTERFSRIRALTVVDRKERADAYLGGRIAHYVTTPISYDRNDKISEYRSTITVEASLRRADNGKVIWKGDVSWKEEYPAGATLTEQEDNETEAIQRISERLADEIFIHIVEDF